MVNRGGIAVNGGTLTHGGGSTTNGVVSVAGGKLVQSGDFVDNGTIAIANPDVKAAKANPLLHFKQHGWMEGRDPLSQFSTGKHLGANPDVKAAAMDSLLHYVQYGQAEERAAFNA